MTLAPATTTTIISHGPRVVECTLCGTRLRRDDADVGEMSADSLVTVARHRCVPRVTIRRR